MAGDAGREGMRSRRGNTLRCPDFAQRHRAHAAFVCAAFAILRGGFGRLIFHLLQLDWLIIILRSERAKEGPS